MSDTFKTHPLRVRLRRARALRPVHDHRHSDCDLPPDPGWDHTTMCLWEPTCAAWYDPAVTGCGCALCTRRDERREARRRERRHGTETARRAARGDIDGW